MGFLEELHARNRVHQHTPNVSDYLTSPSEVPPRAYYGADPTSHSLHIGNLAALMVLVRFHRAGFQPILLVGGATALIGDPSGKSAERQLISLEQVQANVAGIRAQMERLFPTDTGLPEPILVDNYSWYAGMEFLTFLRDVGKHFSINTMLAKDSVANRLENGISFTEFSYQLLQAYDFYYLAKTHGCRLQVGGADQWGNITAGIELIRRMGAGEGHGLTTPLITRPDGSKFGKTATGENIWLDAQKTSPYKLYQFCLNQPDDEMPNLLYTFSLQPVEAIEALLTEHAAQPGARKAQRALAEELTVFLHGREALAGVETASRVVFGKAQPEELAALPPAAFEDLRDELPYHRLAPSLLHQDYPLLDVFADSGLVPSKSEAKRTLKSGGLRVNKAQLPVSDEKRVLAAADLLHGRFVLLQSGKKHYLLVEVAEPTP